MGKKLTTAIATDMVDRIMKIKKEADAAVGAVYREAFDYDGANNANVIRDAVKAREEQNEAAWNAAALLESFDAED